MALILQQLPALIGVIVGVLATYLTTNAMERTRLKHAQKTRWDERRMQAYMKLGHLTKKVSWLAVRIGVARGHSDFMEPLDPDEGIPLLAAAEDEGSVHWEEMLLLGEAETVKAARVWKNAATRVGWLARRDDVTAAEWGQAVRSLEPLRDRFYACARNDLMVEGGDLGNQPLWRPIGFEHIYPRGRSESGVERSADVPGETGHS